MKRALLLLGLLTLLPHPAAGQFESVRVQVIDVGQGDGILVRTPNEEWVLIDAGKTALLGDSLPTHFGVDSLALVVGTHRHDDHVGGTDEVFQSVPVGLYVADTVDRPDVAFDDGVRSAVRARQVRVQAPRADTMEVDGVRFVFLPWERTASHAENNNSVVLRLEYGEFSMLLTGDAEGEERNRLVESVPDLLDVDVLKASHHGSHNGTSPAWLDAVTPDRVVISAGVHGGYKHPHAEAVNAYETATDGRVYCTNRHGTIRVYGFRDGRIRVTRQRPQEKSCTYDGTHY